MKKLVVLLVLLLLGVALYRRFAAPDAPGASGAQGERVHQHGTPDHWPPVVRKPGTETAPAA